MAPKKALTLNEQLALLNDPAPRGASFLRVQNPFFFIYTDTPTTDFDPEALDHEFSDNDHEDDSGSGSEGEEEETADKAREHYVAVGKSALRAQSTAQLGKQYEGARVSRDKLYESEGESEDEDEDGEEDDGVAIDDVMEGDIKFGAQDSDEDDEIESDDALGSDGERFEGWKFRGSRTTEDGVPPERGDKVVESDEESGEEESGDDEDESGSGSDQEGSEEDEEDEEEGEDEEEDEEQRATLSKMMAQEKKFPIPPLRAQFYSNQCTERSPRTSPKPPRPTPRKVPPSASNKRPSTPSSARGSSCKRR
jgi:protein AATF/BFR2